MVQLMHRSTKSSPPYTVQGVYRSQRLEDWRELAPACIELVLLLLSGDNTRLNGEPIPDIPSRAEASGRKNGVGM